MRYEFIVKDTVPGGTAQDSPDLCGTFHPTSGTPLLSPVRDEAEVLRLLESLDHLGLCVVEMRRLPN